MKLLSCEIAEFGVLRNETRTFTDGLNCVCAPNGEGKSTLARVHQGNAVRFAAIDQA